MLPHHVRDRWLPAIVFLALTAAAGCGGSREAAAPAVAADPSVVAVYGDQTLTLPAFEREYARSVGTRDAAAEDSLAAYQDFLERYVDFRLKVMAGEAAGLADDPALREEIATYRTQLARPYLLEREVTAPLLRDLYEKEQEMVDASHILIRVGPDAPPADTLAAYEKLAAIRDSVAQGADFGDMALRYSEDPSAQNEELPIGYRGRLGFFSAGQMVQSFEDMAYATPPGELSPVFRSRFGYHILTVHERRERPANVRISHIMIRPEGPTPADTAAAMEKIAEVQAKLAAGEAFADLAETYSADRQSAALGGDLGEVPYNSRLLPPMKEAAFALENVGDVSGPVETRYGIHLIQLTERMEPDTYEEAEERLKSTLSRLPRSNAAQEQYLKDVLALHNATLDSALVRGTFGDAAADSVLRQLRSGALADAETLLVLGDSTYTLRDLAAYYAANQLERSRNSGPMDAMDVVDQFVDDKALTYEVYRLEQRDPDFAATMREFRDGLILFRIMEDSVWTPAAQDTSALEAYYAAHQEAYQWPERTRVLSAWSRSDSLLNALAGQLQPGATLADVERLAGDAADALRLDTTYVAGPTGSVYDRVLSLEDGAHTSPVAFNNGTVVLIHGGVEAPRGKTFEEARTQVVNDYQEVLEDRLLSRLRARYGAQTYPERLDGAFAGDAATTSTAATE